MEATVPRTAGWRPGDRLTLRGEHWTVAGCTAYADCEALRLDADRDGRRQTFLLPFDRPQFVPRDRIAIVSLRAWFHQFKRLLADSYPYGGLRFCPDTIDLLPYQFEPAIAMLRDAQPRLLIADDVGLGKTIEAGLILRELAMRQDGLRAILLVPAGLRQQWTDELVKRFGLEPILADAAWLRTAERTRPLELNPWSLPGIYVASFDFVKRPEALRPLEDVRWDLVVVDEAHASTLSTDRRAAIDAIGIRSQRVLLLTATPPGDRAEFAALCRIGAFADDPDMAIFQRTGETPKHGARRSSIVAVRLSEAERHMHRTLERYTSRIWTEAAQTGNPHSRLVSTILRKRALSSAAALELSLRRRKDLLSGDVIPRQQQMLLPLDDNLDAEEDLIADAALSTWALANRPTEQQLLDDSIAAASLAAAADSKARVLRKLLKRISEPAIVFTEYRDSLEWVQRLLQTAGVRTSTLHGGLTSTERRTALGEFAEGRATLIATDAAAEGLNLQERCRLVIHYELPWNPARMLQRAGRVDRMGQTRRVHEIALVASDTAEAVVIAPFVRRTAAWHHTSGPSPLQWLTESRIAQAVFEGQPPEATGTSSAASTRMSMDLHADAVNEVKRLQSRRVLLNSSVTAANATDITCATLNRSRLAPGIVLIYEIQVVHQREIVERDLAVFHCDVLLQPWSRNTSLIRRRVAERLPPILSIVSPIASRLARERTERIRVRLITTSDRTRARARLLHQMHESAARKLVQIGLFERRRTRNLDPFLHPSGFLAEGNVQIDADDEADRVTPSVNLRALLVIPPR